MSELLDNLFLRPLRICVGAKIFYLIAYKYVWGVLFVFMYFCIIISSVSHITSNIANKNIPIKVIRLGFSASFSPIVR